MASSTTLPTEPLPHLAMDFARLRAEGIRLLGRLAGEQWTDFNTHDPGITLLEALCYAITDLGYRTSHSIPDLIAGSSDPALPEPGAILTTDPVTEEDLRVLALDVPGVGNAWVDRSVPAPLDLFHHAGSAELGFEPDVADPDARPLRLRGLARVLVQGTDQLSGTAAIQQVAARLHEARRVGSDVEVALLGHFEVRIDVALEVGPVDDPVGVMAAVVEAIEGYLAPTARFTDVAEAMAQGERSLDELLEGPALASGIVTALPRPRHTVHVSDVIHALMDVEDVRAVRSIELLDPRSTQSARWSIDVPAGSIATLAPSSALSLRRAGLPIPVDADALAERLEARRLARARRARDDRGLSRPRGRDRRLARYRSLQRLLPAAYGVGLLGLPQSVTSRRRAQSLQLEAFLLFFDQLLANAHAQLAHAHAQLSPGEGGTRTYFTQVLDDFALDRRLLTDPDAYGDWLDQEVEQGDSVHRHKRFFTHLLARFAEQLDDPPLPRGGEAGSADRPNFLRRYEQLSRARGSGPDILGPEEARGGLEARIRFKLGLRDPGPDLADPRAALDFHVVDHLLLRPVAEDAGQRSGEAESDVPLLAGVDRADPFSLQLSFVMQDVADLSPDFERLVEQTILTETPAHLTPTLHWFGATDGDDHWAAFDDAWRAFRQLQRRYRHRTLIGQGVQDDHLQLRFRDARDRVIDLLGFGRTFPLRDLPFPPHVIVAPGQPTSIPLGFSQRGVRYELRHRDTGEPIELEGQPVAVVGTGDAVALPTPGIDEDVSYRILAVKLQDAEDPERRRETWIHGEVRVEEGVDPTLSVHIDAPLLDLTIDRPQPGDARLVDYGAEAVVVVTESQEGVEYSVIDHADPEQVLSQATVVGTSGTIQIPCVAVTEDVDLRVYGRKEVGDPQDPSIRSATLELVLPLRVRADRARPVELAPQVVEHRAPAVLTVADTQASARYQVWSRRIRDGEFVFDVDPSPPHGTIEVAAEPAGTIRVARSLAPGAWPEATELGPRGDARVGTGQDLELPLEANVEDSVCLVQATKDHRTGPLDTSSSTIASSVQLDRAHAVLVHPDPEPSLALEVTMAGDRTEGAWRVIGGQAGVYYELRVGGESIAQAAYVHQRSDADAGVNKGIDDLRVGVDLAVARSSDTSTTTERPPDPTLEVEPVEVGTALRVAARRAMTQLEVMVAGAVTLEAMPLITVEPPAVTAGQSAQVVVEVSDPDQRYWLQRGDQVLAGPVAGSGEALELSTGAIDERLELFVVAAPATASGEVQLRRRVSVVVDVQ